MKPSLQQAENLKTYLANVLKYKESIDEVYDHVLSALEDKPENSIFQDTVNQILNADFGGGKGLVKMEKTYLNTAIWESVFQIWKYVRHYFQVPNIFYTILLFAGSYFLVTYTKISINKGFLIAFPIGAIVYFALIWTRKFFAGYFTGDTRKSMRDVIIAKIAYPSYWFLVIFWIFVPIKPQIYQLIMVEYPSVFATLLTFYLLYIFAMIKICFEEFKPYLQKSS